MKIYPFFLFVFFFLICPKVNALSLNSEKKFQNSIHGILINKKDSTVISNAKITVKELGIEILSGEDGTFVIPDIPISKFTLVVEHDNYLPFEKYIEDPRQTIKLYLNPNTLQIKEVVVLGIKSNKNGSSSTLINRTAIEHLQASNLKEVLQLIPGSIVENPAFNNTNQASIRQYGADNLGSLGTAVIVNGATLSNNSNLQAINTATAGSGASFSTSSGGGIDLRAITADNVESVEVIRGIPSVEYGDLNSGAILVKTKARQEPLQLKARFNPALTQFWGGKGFGVGKNGGALFVDLDYTTSNDSETNKYRKYERTTGSLQYTGRLSSRWYTNSTLAFGYSRDKYDMDPDYVVDSVQNNSTEKFVRFSTNGTFDFNKKLSRKLQYLFSINYSEQEGYQQQYYTADITAESYALENSTNEVSYLPSSFLSKMWIDGKPLNLNARISNQFYFLTGKYNHNILYGAEWKMDANYGEGKTFTRPIRNTSSAAYRARSYSSIPALHQASVFVQDQLSGTVFNSKLNVVAGLRYDMVQPFESDYSLNAFSPRINTSLATPYGITFRAAYGINTKAPTLLYLYPENAYFDFFSLNYYATNPAERMAIISTRVFNTENHNLKLSKTEKFEAGFDFNLGKANKRKLYVTGYYERTQNGYSMSTTLNSVRFATYPIYSVASQTPGQQPVLSDVVESRTRFVSYYSPSNNINRTNKGIEFELDLGKIEKINTSFNINGAFTSTESTSNMPYILQQNLAGKETTRVGVFAAGRGTVDERLVTTIRAIHHIPELRFLITLSAQTIWMDQNKYVGYEKLPIGYIPYNLSGTEPTIIYFTEQERQNINPITDADIYLNINDATFIKEKWDPLFLFNMKLTKEFKGGLTFSFFANNFVNHRPLQASTRYPNVYEKRNIAFFFGSEISIKL